MHLCSGALSAPSEASQLRGKDTTSPGAGILGCLLYFWECTQQTVLVPLLPRLCVCCCVKQWNTMEFIGHGEHLGPQAAVT